MLRKALLTAATVAITATSALAEEQIVVVTDLGFFPLTTYLVPGETVQFVNQTEAAITVTAVAAEGQEPQWQSPSIGFGNSYSLVVTELTTLEFTSTVSADVLGQFSFDAPPVE